MGEDNASSHFPGAIWVFEGCADRLTRGRCFKSEPRCGYTRVESSWKILCTRLIKYQTRAVLTNALTSDLTIAACGFVLVSYWKVDTHTFWSIYFFYQLVRHSRRRKVTWSWISEVAQIQIWVNSVPLAQRNHYCLLYITITFYIKMMVVPESDFSSWVPRLRTQNNCRLQFCPKNENIK